MDMLTTIEKTRIETLEQYDIMDTVPEEMFDDITAIAAGICNMPIAMINLADDQRLFFKSTLGIGGTEAPLEESVCKVVIRENVDSFEVPDMREDARFKHYEPVIKDPKLVSYFGVPLKTEEGIAIGTLCVVDYEVRRLTPDQKHAMKSLSKQVVYLLELRKKNKLLKEYQHKLEKNSKNIEEFSFMAAHDLKSPIRGIDSFLHILHQKYAEDWDPKDVKYFDIIHNNCERMNTLIHDLLDFAKAGKDKETKEHVDTSHLVHSILTNINNEQQETQARLTMSKLPILRSSKAALTLIFQNLIGNAIKYQPKEQIPEIKIDATETDDEWRFSIMDNGLGIEQKYLKDIFKPFKRLHSQTEYKGSGLGLSGCKKTVRALGGKIWVESFLGKGSSFYFTIPKNNAPI